MEQRIKNDNFLGIIFISFIITFCIIIVCITYFDYKYKMRKLDLIEKGYSISLIEGGK